MIVEYTYTQEFENIFNKLKEHSKYKQLADMDGIGKQTDIVKFSKDFFGNKVTADSSVDANSNVDDNSVIAYEVEAAKPVNRLNAYYLLFKYGWKLFGRDTAEKLVQGQFLKDYYINDFHTFHGKPYSYNPYTSIVIRHDGITEYVTMENLWERFRDKMVNTGDREYFNLFGYEILNNNNEFVPLKTILRHKKDKDMIDIETNNGLCTIVTADHPVILQNGSTIPAKDLKIGDELKSSSSVIPLTYKKDAPFNPYFIGFWLGDGSSSKTQASMISIHQKNIINTNIFNAMSQLNGNISITKERRTAKLYNSSIGKYLQSLGYYSHQRRLPEDIVEWKKEDIISLLCGLIDSEGTIMPTGAVIIRMNSFAIIQQISELVKTLGLKNVYTRTKGKTNREGSFNTNREIFSVSFRITEELMPFFYESDKVIKNKQVTKHIHKDGRFDSYKVSKLSINNDECEYVYDVTTGTGDFHCQGMIQHNCYNFSCLDVVTQGLPFVKKIKSNPPKHLSSFMGQMVQFVTYASNSIAGAVGLADLLICASWYVDKLMEEGMKKNIPDDYLIEQVRQELQSFIYSVNQPFRGGNQSAFTNISIFDSIFLEKLCAEYIFPDGKHPNIDTVTWLQEQYIDLYNNILHQTPFTFPVTTACFATNDDNNILDTNFLDFISEKNKEFCFMNIYAGKTSTLSSCCFDGNTMINIVSDQFHIMTFKEAYKEFKDKTVKTEFEGKVVPAKIVRLPKKGHDMFKVILIDGKSFVCTDNHIHLTNDGEKETVALTVEDKIRVLKNGEVQFIRVSDIEPIDTKERYVYCFEMEDQSSPYFSLANGVSTHNCRLRSSQSNEYFNTFGSGGTKIGSASVTTVNLPRIAYGVHSEEEFIKKLTDKVTQAQQINYIKRHIIQKRINSGNLPLYTLGFMSLKTQYLTCGLSGINEALEIMGYNILSKEGQAFVLKLLNTVNDVNSNLQKEWKVPLNVEQVPAENSAIKLAATDKVLGYNNAFYNYELYSNQFIPLTTSADLLDRIKLQGMFDNEMTGGAICHLNVDTEIKDKELIKSLITHAVKAGVVYHAINYNIQECYDGHITVGKGNTCSVCGKEIENNYTRTVGFLTNTKNWHKVRRIHDYPHRQFYHSINKN